MLHPLLQRKRRRRKKLAELARLAALGLFHSEDEVRRKVSDVDEAAMAFGLIAEWPEAVAEPPEVYLWPENLPVWRIFQEVRTQWYVGINGPTGLNYGGVEVVMRMQRVKRSERAQLFTKIQMMERAMLDAWSEKK